MHTKQQGNMGEAIVLVQCLSHDCEVFTEFGDNSKVDLIIYKNGSLYKVQVKLVGREKKSPNTTRILSYKSGPNYQFRYDELDVDWFAVIDKRTHKIAWIKSDIILSKKRGLYLRHENTNSSNGREVLLFDDFTKFPFA